MKKIARRAAGFLIFFGVLVVIAGTKVDSLWKAIAISAIAVLLLGLLYVGAWLVVGDDD